VSSVLLPIRLSLILSLAASLSFGVTTTKNKRKYHSAVVHRAVASTAVTQRAVVRKASFTGTRPVTAGPVIAGGPWTEPTYADSTVGDNVDGEDLDVRRAAVDALGSFNGSVVVADPASGRILINGSI